MPNQRKLQWPGAPQRIQNNPQTTLWERTCTENALSRQQVPQGTATIHDRGGSMWVGSSVEAYTKDGLGSFCWRWLILQRSDFWTSGWHVPPGFFCAGGVERVESVCPSLSWIAAVPWGTCCRESAFSVQASVQRVGCGLLCILWGAPGHCDFHGFGVNCVWVVVVGYHGVLETAAWYDR